MVRRNGNPLAGGGGGGREIKCNSPMSGQIGDLTARPKNLTRMLTGHSCIRSFFKKKHK